MGKLRVLAGLVVLTVVVLLARGGARAQEEAYALKGTIVTPEQVIENGMVLIVGEKIKEVGQNISLPHGTLVVETDGVILPGFIDLHNHITWNLFPRWKTYKEFGNRYDWQQLAGYGLALSTPHYELGKAKLGCDMNRYAEVKAITEGETSLVGSLGPEKCIEGMARNLDFYSGFYEPGIPGKEKLKNEVFPLELDNATVAQINGALDRQELKAFVVHLSEGKPTDASAAREFKMFAARGFLRSGVSIIHGVALKQSDFKRLAANHVGLIWSPRSNIELYGGTADVAAALSENVKMAIAPDWSPTGSNGMLEELTYATTWNAGQPVAIFSNKELVRMATQYPAQLAGLDDKIGAIAAGKYADVIVLKRKEMDAYDAIGHANAQDVELVIIDGRVVYGNPSAMKKLMAHEKLELFSVCGTEKAISFESEAKAQGVSPKTWTETTRVLGAALREWGSTLAPLAECGN
jgi:5-methylthioadenosine/S-adenosylhomocysteine deaminase